MGVEREYEDWLRKDLGIPEIFLERLRTDDDWTLIIKLHGMIESALSRVIARFFGDSDIEKIISRLETSNPKSGKIAFAKAFGILPADAMKYIQHLSELRNLCAHNPRNFTFSLKAHVDDMTDAQKAAWLDRVDLEPKYPMKRVSETSSAEERRATFLKHPQIALIGATKLVMNYLHCEEVKMYVEEVEEILDVLQKKPARFRIKAGLHTPAKSNPKESGNQG